jgi:hypothetical protein
MNIRFSTSHQYLFSHEQISHVLVLWDKEARIDIYLIDTETPDSLTLRYPGETYRERLWDELGPYFFQVLLDENEQEIPVVLRATFHYKDQLVGMFLAKDDLTPYFFYLHHGKLADIAEEEYSFVIEQFRVVYPQLL